ncbi:MAG: hypothetical protein JST29_08970 [Bacteroidetes bacterium]|nr:hypothetical protein [Bacteroidota bacterium]MBS1591612.1 hypothetical protein [Bacteroidota bacterium]
MGFDQFHLPKGTELYVYNKNGEMITGPITEAENNKNNFWRTLPYKGENITIDFKLPTSKRLLLKLHVSSVAYGYKSLYVSNFGASSSCNINVVCPEGTGWESERNSVALITDGSGRFLFSGALINNTCTLNIPYLLTANHCYIDAPNVSQWQFTFQAWSATCTPSQNTNGVTFNGSTLKANYAGSDFCLVQLNQIPAANSGISYSGWSKQVLLRPLA